MQTFFRGLAALFVAGALSAFAYEFDHGPVFTIIEENDLIVDTDRHYTQGIKLSYLLADGHLPQWLKRVSARVPTVGFENRTERLGIQVGQSIFTPGDLSAAGLLPDDRPYAGWLYTGLILQRRGLTPAGNLTLEHLQLDVGIIGPQSLADKAQTWVHEVRGFDVPRGWDNQLGNEPGVAFKYQRAWLFSPFGKEQRFFDFIPMTGFSLGNVETAFRLGGTVRLGVNLPEDFGAQTVHSLAVPDGGWSPGRASGGWGFYVFAGLEGWAVAYTAFLDGNLFRDSHHVDREPFVAEWRAGGVLVLNRVELGMTFAHRTREFVGQDRDNSFGSVFAKVKF